jgi:hypothetical protein
VAIHASAPKRPFPLLPAYLASSPILDGPFESRVFVKVTFRDSVLQALTLRKPDRSHTNGAFAVDDEALEYRSLVGLINRAKLRNSSPCIRI